MSGILLGQGLFFDRGIDSITVQRQEGGAGLPQLQQLLPATEHGPNQLDRLLARPTLDAHLTARFTPEVRNLEVLMPTVFWRVLRQARDELQQASRRSTSRRDPKAKALARAARVLEEECELRELVQVYQSSLYQG